MLAVNKIMAGLIGLGLLGQTYIADCASRKDLDIPEPEDCFEEGIDLKQGLYVRHCIVDGKMYEEVFDLLYYKPPIYMRKVLPRGIWYDRNGNGEVEDNEIYLSPNSDEDWECLIKPTKI